MNEWSADFESAPWHTQRMRKFAELQFAFAATPGHARRTSHAAGADCKSALLLSRPTSAQLKVVVSLVGST